MTALYWGRFIFLSLLLLVAVGLVALNFLKKR